MRPRFSADNPSGVGLARATVQQNGLATQATTQFWQGARLHWEANAAEQILESWIRPQVGESGVDFQLH